MRPNGHYGEALGIRLANVRKFKGLTLQKVEADVGICIPTLSRIERGKPSSYEIGKKLEAWLIEIGEPVVCAHCNGKGFK